MDLQQFRYALAVAEELNFTRAAEKCHVVQSALSHQIKALERELGVQLFARTSRRVEVTEAGFAFLAEAQTAVAAADRAKDVGSIATGQIRGSLTIGVIPTLTGIDMAAALGDFHRAHPAVHISLQVGDSQQFIAMIRSGTMDLAVLGLADTVLPEKVSTVVVARENLVAVVGRQHALAQRRRLRLSEVADETFVDFPHGTPGRTQSDLAFSAAALTRNVPFEVMNAELILDLVEHGLAIALLSPAAVPNTRDLAMVPLIDGPRRIEYLAWSEFNPSPAAVAFRAVLQKRLLP